MDRPKIAGHDWYASGHGGAVAAGGQLAVAAGMRMLAQGGNAADAAVATLLALSVTDYGAYAIGAEIPLMIYDAKEEKVKVLCGLGCAPLAPEAISWFMEHGIPHSGGLKAAPVPGAVSLCFETLRLYGTMTFAQVVSPTLALLASGAEAWHAPLARTLQRLVEAEADGEGDRETRLQRSRDRFYGGDIADELVPYYRREGSFLRKEDLAAHATRLEDPVCSDFRGYTVCKCDTWTQGPSLLQALRLIDGFDLRAMGHLSADTIHVTIEALKLAFADRDEHYGDPLFADVPIDALLSDQYTSIRRALIDMQSASLETRPGDPRRMRAESEPSETPPLPGGTTTCVVGDRWGNIVAATPSGNPPYAVCDELGVAHGNRLRSFNTMPGHPNVIQAGKRPRITLTPTLVLHEGKGLMAISVAGADLQEQTTLNVLLNMIEFGMSPAEAVTCSRFSTDHRQDSFNPSPDRPTTLGQMGSLSVSAGLDPNVQAELSHRGHQVTITSDPIARPVVLYRDPKTKLLSVAGDPSAGRHAGALQA